MSFTFSKTTFSYFEGARRHSHDRDWFEAHRAQYEEHVLLPFTQLVRHLHAELASSLPGVLFSSRRISKPLMRQTKDSTGSFLRETASVLLAEPTTSMFESNPGMYLSFGAKPEDNVIGCGLYMPSSRQLRELRPRFYAEHAELSAVLGAADLKRHWNVLAGERYRRFPKELDEGAPGAEYAWHKQFYLGKELSKEQICAPDFPERATEMFAAAVPFLKWTRRAVGVYRRVEPLGERAQLNRYR